MRNVYFAVLNTIPFLPYVYGLLRAHAEEDGTVRDNYRFQDPFFLLERPEAIVDRLEQPTVFGFSCYVWNFRKHMKVAKLCKQRFPETLIVAGGPHVPNRVADFFEEHPYVDFLVHGEGEIPFQGILREALKSTPDWASVPSISFVGDGGVHSTPRGATLPREIQLRSPYLAGFLDASIETCKARQIEFYAPWETNRGCPYSCSFCDWGSATMSKVRRFNEVQLLREADYFGEQSVPQVFICDANFGILPRDLEIANRLVDNHAEHGYPQRVRVNFAKNSNDRVFDISKAWADNDMLMGTTLSMQSTNLEVLEAIDRKNIGVARYQELQRRYAQAGIHTYTELILGLPAESKQSFMQGIGMLLEAGNHEDLRVYEFDILPNAPVNHPQTLAKFGIKTIVKQMHRELPGTPEDEFERVPVVFETNALSRQDWVDCNSFSQLIQFLHNGCFTRYLSIFLRREYELSYYAFYNGLREYFSDRPRTVLGSVLKIIQGLFQQYQDDPSLPQINLVASQPALMERLKVYSRRIGWTPDNMAWLFIAEEQERFYRELSGFLDTLGLDDAKAFREILRFQNDIMLSLEYDPAVGKTCYYEVDFPSYFKNGGPLETTPVQVVYRDNHFGVNRQYPLARGDHRKFCKAAVGTSYPFVRVRHFQHQLAEAEVACVSSETYQTAMGC